MTIKTILTHVETTPESDLRIRLASGLARELGAELIGVGGRVPSYVTYPGLAFAGSDIIDAVVNDENATLAEAEGRFRAVAEGLAAATWRADSDYPNRAIEESAPRADLIVASAARGPSTSVVDTADLILRAGLPVLVVPADLTALRTKHIVIGWKNTREARRAVSDAMPLLEAADEVCAVQVCDRADDPDAWATLDDLGDRLARHGITAHAETVEKSGDVASSLVKFAEGRLADLIVSGAYGHSRAREWTLGGMTHGLLQASTLPMLFSH